MQGRWNSLVLSGAAVLFFAVQPSYADMALATGYSLNLVNLGPVSVPSNYSYEGLTFSGQNLLLAAWDPAQLSYPTSEVLSNVAVNRSANGQIVGLGATSAGATVATVDTSQPGYASYSYMVGGGLAAGAGGTLFYTTTEGNLGQYLANGSSQVSTLTDPLNPGATVNALGFVPIGTSSQLVVAFSDQNWYIATLASGQNGFYNVSVSSGNLLFSGVYADSFTYFPASPQFGFSGAGLLVGDDSSGAPVNLTIYGIDSQGHLTGTPVSLVTNQALGPFPGYGVARDPRTGGFLFTTEDATTGNGQVWELQIQTPEPSTAAMAILAAILALGWRRYRATGSPL